MSHSLLNDAPSITNLTAGRYQRIRLPLVKTSDVKDLCARVFKSLPVEYSKHAAIQVKMSSDIAELTLEFTTASNTPSWVEASFDSDFMAHFRTVPIALAAGDTNVAALDKLPDIAFLAVPSVGLDGIPYGANNRWATVETRVDGETPAFRCKYEGTDGSVLTNTCNGDYPVTMVDSWVTGRTQYIVAGNAHISNDGVVRIDPTDYLATLTQFLDYPAMRLGIVGGGKFASPNGMVTYSHVNHVMLNGVVINVA